MATGKMNPTAADDTVREKIGGWLYLPAFGLVAGCFGLALELLVAIVVLSLPPLQVTDPRDHKMHEIGVACISLGTILMAVQVYAAIRFFRKKRNAPAAVIALLITQVVVYGSLIAMFVLADADRTITDNIRVVAQDSVIALVGAVLAAAVWIPYFRVSKRVKRTFVVD